jgi:hypothetical protein
VVAVPPQADLVSLQAAHRPGQGLCQGVSNRSTACALGAQRGLRHQLCCAVLLAVCVLCTAGLARGQTRMRCSKHLGPVIPTGPSIIGNT